MGISNISQGFAGFPLVGRHPVAGVPERIFASGRVSLITPRLKIGLRPVRQEHAPRGLEVGAGLVEGGGGAALVLARMRARIEAAPLFPRIGVVRVAGADHDRADADVAEVDLPAFVAGFEIAAAGKDGRGIIEAWPGRAGNGKREMAPARGDALRPLEVVSRGPRNTGKQYDALHLSPRRPLGCQGPPRGPS
jgi:hypothetical protein